MKVFNVKSMFTGFLLGAVASVCSFNTYAQELEGKTVTILVGFNPGGGTDTGARLLNKYLSKHIPGNPDVIVKNMTGPGRHILMS